MTPTLLVLNGNPKPDSPATPSPGSMPAAPSKGRARHPASRGAARLRAGSSPWL